MRDNNWLNKSLEKKTAHFGKNRIISSIVLTAIFLAALSSILPIFMANPQGYTPVTETCISCHNDTGYPDDTNLDGRIAPYKRPHNDTIMCESCHLTNPHNVLFILPDGNYGTRSTAASCPECHQGIIPNANFTRAPIIPNPLR
ncbi:MAG: hypothetical protein O8C59_01650, partial [Candidatus Methanoperedens sp.]|nr:hypothetical protein [Candidatus Methanoperedens sp.]